MMRVEDEYGTGWIVRAGDPGSKLVNRLKRETERLDYVVLPRVSLVTGSVEEPDLIPDEIIPAIRLRDCLNLLKEGS